MPHLRTGGIERHRFAVAIMVVSVGMIPWIVYLALTLPKTYVAGHWTLLWVGFDVGLVALLVSTALAAWRRRQIMVPLLLVTATLLFCDAWFDVVTSFGRPGGWVSVVTAVFAEIPLAIAFLWLYRRIVLATIAEARRRAGDPDGPRRLWDIQVLDGSAHEHLDTSQELAAGALPTVGDHATKVEVDGRRGRCDDVIVHRVRVHLDRCADDPGEAMARVLALGGLVGPPGSILPG